MVEKINIGDFSLSVKIEGEGKRGNIMLIHCLGLSNRVFDHQIEFLASEGYKVFAPDVRCHGDSDKPELECSIWDLVDDIEKLISKLGINRFLAIGGISMGGMISMRLFIRNKDIADKLILMGTSADEDPGKERYAPMINNLLEIVQKEKDEKVLEENFRNSAEYLVRLCFSQSYLEKNFDFWVSQALKSQGKGGIYVAKAVIERDSVLDQIKNIDKPTLIMAGEQDLAVPVKESYKIKERIKNSRLVIFENAPHIFTPEIPHRVNEEIYKFLVEN